VCGALTALYGSLYLLLHLEAYALVAKSMALLALLAFVMFVARRMNWYDLALGSVTCERRPRSGVE
jgi:inner membrane protein